MRQLFTLLFLFGICSFLSAQYALESKVREGYLEDGQEFSEWWDSTHFFYSHYNPGILSEFGPKRNKIGRIEFRHAAENHPNYKEAKVYYRSAVTSEPAESTIHSSHFGQNGLVDTTYSDYVIKKDRTIFKYDNANNITSRKFEQLNSDNQWITRFECNFVFNELGDEVVKTYNRYDYDGDLQRVEIDSSFYNENDKLIAIYSYSSSASIPENMPSKTTHILYKNTQIDSVIRYSFSASFDSTFLRDITTFSYSGNRLDHYFIRSFNAGTNSFSNFSEKESFIYNDQGLLIKHRIRHLGGFDWSEYNDYEYNDEGLITSKHVYWDLGNADYTRETFLYEKVSTVIKSVEELSFDISPNPTSNNLSISGLSNIDEVRITNSASQLILIQQGIDFNVDISHLPSGTYFLNVQSGGNSATKKFVKH